ncbi:amidohydrolase family protein [Loigolactobacillus backii]|uniref:Amidohydrolase n=1 Tax=Loigolactobacillus backii TaxID=375175 RepID=A0A192GY08_9LACO|nr:amidohydrolase family protein [Loigolactobacillus backii]ANK58925.1 amidohydrolase [Loigolactobacillus backii]ANK61404.1 amidohydrolase [Loigolactobacillus backii]ANK63913.1 amidohydrolase [Loigolactobacillus backii]ANK66361.1 amidohydrolase [Loigolactobacillus backii]ANK69396.1 amidohydrolase [Loigolactobacillus backii]
MKIITVEEHFESELITQKINQVTGKGALPPLSSGMLEYMKTSLPTAEMMQSITGTRLDFMDQNGIAMQVLSYGNSSPQNLAPEIAIDLCKEANDKLAKEIQKQPDRFAAFAVLPVGDPTAAAQELKRAVEQLNFKGALLKGNYQGQFFDDPFFFPIFKMASDLDVPIYMHPSFIPSEINDHYFKSPNWSDTVNGILSSAGYGWHMDVGIQVIRMIVSGIFDKLPNLKLISGHWGEMVPMFLERLDDELDDYSGLKESFSTYYRNNVYLTPSGMLFEPQLKFILDEMGPEHLLYSIDYPYKHPANSQTFLTEGNLPAQTKELIAHGNAERLLHL